MNNSIYVNDNNVIYNYEVSFDREQFERVIDEIDTWYGKGELKTYIGDVCPEVPGRKTDVFAEVELCNDKKEYFYYQYIQHPLARTANAIMNNQDVFESSKLIKILSTWNASSDEEMKFVIKLMSCFEFNKVNLGEVFVLDLTDEESKGFFERIRDAIMKVKEDRFIVVGSRVFCGELDDAVSGIFRDKEELLGGKFIASEKDKKFTKKRYIMALPTSKDISK